MKLRDLLASTLGLCGMLSLALAAHAGPTGGGVCDPVITRLATPGKLTLSGPKGFLLTKSATVKGRINETATCPADAVRNGRVDLVVRNVSLSTVIHTATIDSGRRGPFVWEEGSTSVAKFAVPFTSTACNGVPVAGSGVPTVGEIRYEATAVNTDDSTTGTATKTIPVTCKPAK